MSNIMISIKYPYNNTSIRQLLQMAVMSLR